MHFGLPCVSPQDGQWYRRWPEEISYSTSLAETKSRAEAGCVWCRLLVSSLAQIEDSSPAEPSLPFEITVRGSSTREYAENWTPKNAQRIDVITNNTSIFMGLVHTTPSTSAYE